MGPQPGWTVVGPAALVSALGPLIALRRQQGPISVLTGEVPDLSHLLRSGAGRDRSVLVVSGEDEMYRSDTSNGPVLRCPDGRATVVGWLRGDIDRVAAYARVAVAISHRGPIDGAQPLVLLAPRERRYCDLQARVGAAANSIPGLAPFLWTAERVRREPLLAALGIGLGPVLYIGHGNAAGWLAYRGLLADDLAVIAHRAIAALFSLSCRTGAPGRPPSFAETVIRRGYAGAVLAPLGNTNHVATCTFAPALVRALGRTPSSLSTALATQELDCSGYVLWGDPAVQPLADAQALDICRAVQAPAPDAFTAL